MAPSNKIHAHNISIDVDTSSDYNIESPTKLPPFSDIFSSRGSIGDESDYFDDLSSIPTTMINENDGNNSINSINPITNSTLKPCIKQKNVSIKPSMNVVFASELDDGTEKLTSFNYSRFVFTKLKLSENYKIRHLMITDFMLSYLQCVIITIIDKMRFIDSFLREINRLNKKPENTNDIIKFHKNITHQFKNFIRFFADIHSYSIIDFDYKNNSISNNLDVIISKLSIFSSLDNYIKTICNFIDRNCEIIIEDERSLYSKHVAHEAKYKGNILHKEQGKIKKRIHQIFRREQSTDYVDSKFYKYQSFRQDMAQKQEYKSLLNQFNLFSRILKVSIDQILRLFQTLRISNIAVGPLQFPAIPIIRKQMVMTHTLIPQLSVDVYFYPNLSILMIPSAYIASIDKQIMIKAIHSFPGDWIFMKQNQICQQIIRFDNKTNSFQLYLSWRYTTNAFPKTYLKWKNINDEIQKHYDELVSDIKNIKQTFTEIQSGGPSGHYRESVTYIKWIEDLYLLLSVLIAELDGRFGIDNLYSGSSKLQNIAFALTTTIWYEIPVRKYNNLTSKQLEGMSIIQRIHKTA